MSRGADGGVLLAAAEHLGADRAARGASSRRSTGTRRTRGRSGNLRQWANHATRRGKPGEPLDLAAAARRWAAQARASDAGALEPVMPAVTTRRGLLARPGQRASPLAGSRR